MIGIGFSIEVMTKGKVLHEAGVRRETAAAKTAHQRGRRSGSVAGKAKTLACDEKPAERGGEQLGQLVEIPQ
jgi:hypothetical protein